MNKLDSGGGGDIVAAGATGALRAQYNAATAHLAGGSEQTCSPDKRFGDRPRPKELKSPDALTKGPERQVIQTWVRRVSGPRSKVQSSKGSPGQGAKGLQQGQNLGKQVAWRARDPLHVRSKTKIEVAPPLQQESKPSTTHK